MDWFLYDNGLCHERVNWLMYIWFIDGFFKEVELVFGKHSDNLYFRV